MNLGNSVTPDIHTRGYITVVFVVSLSCFFSFVPNGVNGQPSYLMCVVGIYYTRRRLNQKQLVIQIQRYYKVPSKLLHNQIIVKRSIPCGQ